MYVLGEHTKDVQIIMELVPTWMTPAGRRGTSYSNVIARRIVEWYGQFLVLKDYFSISRKTRSDFLASIRSMLNIRVWIKKRYRFSVA